MPLWVLLTLHPRALLFRVLQIQTAWGVLMVVIAIVVAPEMFFSPHMEPRFTFQRAKEYHARLIPLAPTFLLDVFVDPAMVGL